jgi:hypothetical protein
LLLFEVVGFELSRKLERDGGAGGAQMEPEAFKALRRLLRNIREESAECSHLVEVIAGPEAYWVRDPEDLKAILASVLVTVESLEPWSLTTRFEPIDHLIVR